MVEVDKRSAGEALKTLVLLCDDLGSAQPGLGLAAIGDWLSEHYADVHVGIVPHLCHEPRAVREAVGSHRVERLVIGLCSADYPRAEMETQARKAGLDALGVEVVNLGDYCGGLPILQRTEVAKLLLAAAIARARAFSGASPENTRPVFLWGEKVSRRALFTLPPLRYRPVAFIEASRCATDSGCRICIEACPRQALAWGEDQIVVNKPRCAACGLCVAACPRQAIDLPGHSPRQLEAQLATLLEGGPVCLAERPVLIACTRTLGAWRGKGWRGASGWLPVEVPCVGMVPLAGLLQGLWRGATVVGVAPCTAGCELDQLAVIKGRIDYCQQVLLLLGEPQERVRFVGPSDARTPPSAEPGNRRELGEAAEWPRLHLFGPGAAVQALRAPVPGHVALPALAHRYSPLGLVHLSPEQCSRCGVCASACPVAALRLEQSEEGVALTFDASLCTGCAQCAAACPEADSGALQVEPITDFARLQEGRVALYRDGGARCVACGAPIASQGVLRRVSALLGEDSPTLKATIRRYCPSCRGQRR